MVRSWRKLNQNKSVLTIGPICLDELKFEHDGTQSRYPGGNAVITGSILAVMGIETNVFGIIGDDHFGHVIRRHLSASGVDLSLLYSTRDWRTKIGRNVVGRDGQWRRDRTNEVTVPYLLEGRTPPDLTRFSHLHIGALNSLLRTTPTTTCTILTACREQGLTISIGVAGTHFDVSEVNQLLKISDTIVCNADEFCHLHESRFTNLKDLLSQLIESRFAECVVTIGEFGAIARRNQQTLHVNPLGTRITPLTGTHTLQQLEEALYIPSDSERVVESTVGAGDVFAGVFIASKLHDFDLSVCLRAAAAAASLSVLDHTWDAWLRDHSNLTALLPDREN